MEKLEKKEVLENFLNQSVFRGFTEKDDKKKKKDGKILFNQIYRNYMVSGFIEEEVLEILNDFYIDDYYIRHKHSFFEVYEAFYRRFYWDENDSKKTLKMTDEEFHNYLEKQFRRYKFFKDDNRLCQTEDYFYFHY